VPQAYDGNGLQGMFMEPGPMENHTLLSGLRNDAGGTSSDEAPPVLGMVRTFPNLSHTRAPPPTADAGGGGGGRPSFKRLPSQTLENAVQKRAAVRWGGGEEAVDSATDSEEVEGAPRAIVGLRSGGRGGMPPPPPPPAAPLQAFNAESLGMMERYRRQSAPTGVRPAVNGTATKQEATAAQ